MCYGDAAHALSSALSQLSVGLEHLSLSRLSIKNVRVPVDVLQKLTYLELGHLSLQGPDQASPPLQLQPLTRLVDLRLNRLNASKKKVTVTASMLSGMQHLTRLDLIACISEPGATSGWLARRACTTLTCGAACGVTILQREMLTRCPTCSTCRS
jgi:hypothetical protein